MVYGAGYAHRVTEEAPPHRQLKPGTNRRLIGPLRCCARGKAFDAQLLTNGRVEFSPIARAQLRSGQVDPWLPDLIAIMAQSYPLSIVDFSSQSPGGGPASLMRWMDLATNVPKAHLTRAAYLNRMRSFLDAQLAEFHPD